MKHEARYNFENFEISKVYKEPTIYWKNDGENVLILAVYVDDLFIIGTSVNMIKKFKIEMSKISKCQILVSEHITLALK